VAESSQPSSGSRLSGIEGLRAIAALCVLTTHVWQFAAPHGTDFGVLNNAFFGNLAQGLTLFFALSGFLLYRPFATALLSGAARPRIATYARNRALRILPAYWVILVLVQIIGAAAVDNTPGQSAVGRMSAGTFIPNFLLVQNYIPTTNGTGITPAWSLVVEVVFYVCLPLLAIAAYRLVANGRSVLAGVLMPPLALLVVGLTARFVAIAMHANVGNLTTGSTWTAVFGRSFLVNADLFAFGMAAAVVVAYVAVRKPPWSADLARRAGVYAVLAGVAALAAQHTALNAWLFTDLVAVAAGLLITWVVFLRRQSPAQRLLCARAVRWTGDVSYSLYLWHVPVILWLRTHDHTFDGRAGFVINWLMVTAIALVLAGLTHRFVEVPAMARRSRTSGRAIDTEAAEQQAAP
jgi:peptidoglycan/LPS O-acetylase OafA/YrhL